MLTLRPLLQFSAALVALFAFALVGQLSTRLLNAPIPGVVFGLAFLALAMALLRQWRPAYELCTAEFLAPASRPLLRHLGLLFVPAGAGVMMQWPIIRVEWLAVLAGLFGSTLVGLAVTAWITQRLWPKDLQP